MRSVTSCSKVEDIPQEQWNILTQPSDFTLTTPMLGLIQRARPKPVRFFMVWNHTTTLQGAVPVYLIEEASTVSSYLRPDLMLQRVVGQDKDLAGLGADELLPTAFIGSYQSTSARMLLDQTLSYQEQLTHATTLLDLAEEQAKTWNARSLCCPYVAASDKVLQEALNKRGYLSFPNSWFAVLDVQWSDFNGYLHSLSGHYQREVRRERKKVANAGLQIGIAPLAMEDVPRLDILKSNLDTKYHGQAVKPTRSTLAVAAQERPGEPLVALGRKDGEIVGFCLAYRYQDELYCEQGGFDYQQIANVPLYFELAYYQYIEYAITHGIRRLNYGAEAYKAKLLRGCTFEPQLAFIKCFDPVTQNKLSNITESLDAQKLYQEVVLA